MLRFSRIVCRTKIYRQNNLICVRFMKKQLLNNILFILLAICLIAFSGCKSSHKGFCGCPGKTGMGGYN